ncbi:SH3 domain-containing protein [Domibacillus robiginosus]|uniref:SH3 domain-containing protein n=1 Tax=Domibacillus robiginosus TaxID=1071054 RepID=UPI00067B3A10|nr:SH3 domain-containing protein [Domibacillus robiginosus]
MKKIASSFLAFILVLSVLSFGNQAEAAVVNKHFTVNVTKLDVREKPSPRAKTVGSLKKGAGVFVYNTEPGGWSKIKYNGKAGYVATSGLSGQGSSAKPAPTKTTPVLMKDITFGMTYQQVKNRETRGLYYDYYDPLITSYLTYDPKKSKYNMTSHLVYKFDYKSLVNVWYDFNPKRNYHTISQLRSYYMKLQAQGIKEFGGNYYYNHTQNDDYVDFSSRWSLDGYDVTLGVTNKLGYSTITLYYDPVGYQSSSSQNDEEKFKHLIEEIEKYNKQLDRH